MSFVIQNSETYELSVTEILCAVCSNHVTLPSSIQWKRLSSESFDRHSRSNSSHDLVHSFENVFRQSRLQVGLSALEQQCSLAESMPMRSIRDTSTVAGPDADSELWRKHCHNLSCKLKEQWWVSLCSIIVLLFCYIFICNVLLCFHSVALYFLLLDAEAVGPWDMNG